MEYEGVRFAHFFDITDVPDVNAMVVVDDSDFEMLFVIGDGRGVGVPDSRGVGYHVTNGEPFGNVHTQIMGSG